MLKPIQEFRLETGVAPFCSDSSAMVLNQAAAMLTVFAAAIEDGHWLQEYHDRWIVNGKPSDWPLKVGNYPPESSLVTMSPAIVARAVEGIGSLVALGIHLSESRT